MPSPQDKSRVLVVGASGFVGQHLYHHLRHEGYVTFGTQAKGLHGDLLKFDLRSDRIRDILPQELLREGASYCACICAGVASVDLCGRDPEMSRIVNVTHMIRMIDDLASRGWRIVYFSTSAVFDGKMPLYDESVPPAPLHEYGRQKAAVEQHVLTRVPGGLVVRLSKALDINPAARNLFSEWLGLVAQQRPIQCVEGESFSPTWVRDIGTAIARLIDLRPEGLFHVVNRECFRRDELAKLFLRTMGRDVPVINRPPEHFGFTEPRPLCSCLDNRKLIEATGMKFTSVAKMLEMFFESVATTNRPGEA